MVTFILLAAVALCALLIGLVVAVGDKTPAVAATTAESAKADSHSSWAAVRALILNRSHGPSAVAYRARETARRTAKAAKRHRRWERRATAAEGRAKALAETKARRLALRQAAKAEAREKSRAVAQRHGHAAARRTAIARRLELQALASGQEAVQAHRRLVVAGLVAPVTLVAGIKAQKRAGRGSTVAANARKREARMVAAQQRNAADRAVAAEWQSAFEAQQEVRQTARRAAAADVRARRSALAAMTPDQVRLAQAVVRLERKALAKLRLMAWLEAGNGKATKGGLDRTLHLTGQAVAAREGFEAAFGVALEAGASWAAWKAAKANVRAATKVAA